MHALFIEEVQNQIHRHHLHQVLADDIKISQWQHRNKKSKVADLNSQITPQLGILIITIIFIIQLS